MTYSKTIKRLKVTADDQAQFPAGVRITNKSLARAEHVAAKIGLEDDTDGHRLLVGLLAYAAEHPKTAARFPDIAANAVKMKHNLSLVMKALARSK
jgi:hypothetical protein